MHVVTKGYADCSGTLFDLKGNQIWQYPHPKEGDKDFTWKVKDPYIQEQINLVNSIRTGKPINDAEAQVNSTLITIMGRIA